MFLQVLFYQTGNLLCIKIVEFLWWISSKLTKKIYADAISVFYFRSSLPEAFCKKYVKNFVKLAGNHLCPSLFFNKVACLRHAILLKKRLARAFSCEFYGILNKACLNTSGGCFCYLLTLNLFGTLSGV